MEHAETTGRTRHGATRGDPDADDDGFATFYGSHYHRVVKLAYVLVGQLPVAEEVAQEAFLRALNRWDGRLTRPDVWIRTTAANLARSRLRRVRAELRALTRLDHPRAAVPDIVPPELSDCWQAVRALPHRQAQAVALYYFDDLPIRDVAAVMGCAEGTAKALLHQARTRLASELGTHGDGS